MKYQARANFLFGSKAEAKGFYNSCKLIYSETIAINPGTEAEEIPTLELIENHHDENPNAPCKVIAQLPKKARATTTYSG